MVTAGCAIAWFHPHAPGDGTPAGGECEPALVGRLPPTRSSAASAACGASLLWAVPFAVAYRCLGPAGRCCACSRSKAARQVSALAVCCCERGPHVIEAGAQLGDQLVRGLQVNDHIAGSGEAVFRHACAIGLEGIVSKRLNSRYRSGRTIDWLKMKNPEAPASKRETEEDWDKGR